MFTDDGKNLAARKLGGITDSCIDYIAIGIGGRPIPSKITNVSDLSHQSGPLTQMKHEIARVPIKTALPSSNGIIKCMTDLPANLSCEFTELSIWTHANNAASSHPDTQPISLFETNEGWIYDDLSNADAPLQSEISSSGEADYFAINNKITSTGACALFSSYDDILWTMRGYRKIRKEGFKVGDAGVLVRGDMSTISGTAPFTSLSGEYIYLPINGLPFDNASISDQLKLSYFVSPLDSSTSPLEPSSVKVCIDFVTNDSKHAKWSIYHAPSSTTMTIDGSNTVTSISSPSLIRNGDDLWGNAAMNYPADFYFDGTNSGKLTLKSGKNAGAQTVNINQILFSIGSGSNQTIPNTYFTQYTSLSESNTSRNSIQYDSGFLWANVAKLQIYVSVAAPGGKTPADYFVGLDALSFVNTDTVNPGYGMVAYDIAKNYETRGILTRSGSPTSVVFEVQIV